MKIKKKNRIKKLVFIAPDFPGFEIRVTLQSGKKGVKVEVHKKDGQSK